MRNQSIQLVSITTHREMSVINFGSVVIIVVPFCLVHGWVGRLKGDGGEMSLLC